mmetsp:Transcript_54652/g.116774  ORF Transcript_54652/g.116774 Transcript_54652/m.116774 type:complete len:383 (-) Transcript_54652:89-1237(-)
MDWVCRLACFRGQQECIDGRWVRQQGLIADGGFAFVYRGVEVQSGQQIAIRRALLQDDEARTAAKDEIALLESLPPHDHIVRFLGGELLRNSSTGRSTEAVTLFELCPGGTLVDRLQEAMDKQVPSAKEVSSSGPAGPAGPYCCPCLPEAGVFEVLMAVASALSTLHGMKIVHYDVKSENLMMGSDGRWKLGDFGSASKRTFDFGDSGSTAGRPRVLDAEEFISGRCTPMYRAPEVADIYLRWPIGPKVDIFALGCVIFATMTGGHPFPADSQLANVQAQYKLPKEALSAYTNTCLEWVRRLLSKEPEQRPSAKQIVDEVGSGSSSSRSQQGRTSSGGSRGSSSRSVPSQAMPTKQDDWNADFADFGSQPQARSTNSGRNLR